MENPTFNGIMETESGYITFAESPANRNGAASRTKPRKQPKRVELFVIICMALGLAVVGVEIYQVYLQLDVGKPLKDISADKNESTDVTPQPPITGSKDMQSCMDYFLAGYRESGVYTIYTDVSTVGFTSRSGYCEMSDSYGWTIILRREDGSVNFNRNWDSYKRGFGEASGEYYIGNDLLNYMTTKSGHQNILRVDLTSNVNGTRYAEYTTFSVADDRNFYKLTVGGYTGTAGDSLGSNNGQNFTTYDQDNDAHSSANCALLITGGWWFSGCGNTDLTGLYGQNIWRTWLGREMFLDYAVVKITYDS